MKSEPLALMPMVAFGVRAKMLPEKAYSNLNDLIATAADINSLCRQRLDTISQADLDGLTGFTRWKLGSELDILAEDVVQSALDAILEDLDANGGRKPRLVDVSDHGAFLKYLRGVISSKADASVRHSGLSTAIELSPDLPVDGLSPAEDVELTDVKQAFIASLKQQAPWRLQSTIDAWNEVFWTSDQIPTVNGHRKYGTEIKRLAQEIVKNYGFCKDMQSKHLDYNNLVSGGNTMQ
jgi:hypothetical protein